MYAARWKFKLLKNYRIQFLPISNHCNNDLEKDMKRTYPTVEWFRKHERELSNILLNFIEMNPALSYMQGMCFIVFTLFYTFRHSDFRSCETLYCLHKIVEPIRPIYPLNENDRSPLLFIDSTAKIILLKINQRSKALSELLDIDIVKIFIVSGFPSFFGNWYNLEETIKLYDVLIDESPVKMLNNMIQFLACFFLYHKQIILNSTLEQTMYILQQKGNLKKILNLMETKNSP